MYMVLERAEIDLYDYFEDGVPENEARHIISSLLKAVGHCHRNGVVHRDIKVRGRVGDEGTPAGGRRPRQDTVVVMAMSKRLPKISHAACASIPMAYNP